MKKVLETIDFIFEKGWPAILIFALFVTFLRDWNRHGLWAAVFWIIGVVLVALLIASITWFISSIVEKIKTSKK